MEMFSNLRVSPFTREGSHVKAMVSVTVAGVLQLDKMRIVEGPRGLFLSMPDRKNDKTNEYEELCHFKSTEALDILKKLVFAEYEKKTTQAPVEAAGNDNVAFLKQL